MGSRGSDIDDQSTADGTPEDVAVLYSWANLQGAKYRDYSASRREHRAHVRYRAAKALLERELEAQLRAEANAAEAERVARTAEAAANADDSTSHAARVLSQRSVEEAARKASAERVKAARTAEAAARAAILALREEREIAEAHSSARRQALVYEGAELRRRELAGPQPHRLVGDSHGSADVAQGDLRSGSSENPQQFLFSNWQDSVPLSSWTSYVPVSPGGDAVNLRAEAAAGSREGDLDTPPARLEYGEEEQTAPAWLFPTQMPARDQDSPPLSSHFRGDTTAGDTLQDSRERVAARWFALKDVFELAGPELPAMQPLRPREDQTPILAVFSLAGGVGKTSLIATLARAFAEQGERVALTDTTSQGLLPIYFGSREVRQGASLNYPLRSDAHKLPVHLVVRDLERGAEGDPQQEMLAEEILRGAQGSHRLLLDLGSGSNWLIRRMADFHPIVLVPMSPDMNSVISLQAVERLFRGIVDTEGRPVLPFYVLNRFDASLALHLDVREVLRRQIGDRLLRFAIRRSAAVSEALADGMTVLDYMPDAPVSQDYRDIATWLGSVSPPATETFRVTGWGGQ